MSSTPHAGTVEIFKARTNIWFAWLSWSVAALGIVVTVITAGPAALAGTAPLLLIAFLGWQLFWMPAVVVHERGVTLENPFRSVVVPWEALVHVDTRFALTLVTAHKSYAAWAAPAPESGAGATPSRRTSGACLQQPTVPASPCGPGTSRPRIPARQRGLYGPAGSTWWKAASLPPVTPLPPR
ncbi:PH domain-containing protein [Arthrobacter sp. OVS8]|nr:PH domain-containing protein [Arthrobacter sp. OVS8]